MEKSLLEKMRNNTCDEIDKIMITSRVAKAMQEVHPVVSDFCEKIESLCNEYSDELKMAGFALVMGLTDITDDKDNVGLRIVYGTRSRVNKVYEAITKEINE